MQEVALKKSDLAERVKIKKYQKIITAVCLIAIGCSVGASAWAALVPCGGEGQPACKLCHLWQLFSNLINFLLIDIVIPVAVVLFVASGVVFLTSGGSTTRIELAKKIIRSAITGLVIIFLSWLIIDTIMKTLAGSSAAFHLIGAWNKFPGCN